MVKEAESNCSQMATDLFTFLEDKNVLEGFKTWQEEDAPDVIADDYEMTKAKASEMIVERIETEIRNWETQQDYVNKIYAHLTELLNEECFALDAKEDETKLILLGNAANVPLVLHSKLYCFYFSFLSQKGKHKCLLYIYEVY